MKKSDNNATGKVRKKDAFTVTEVGSLVDQFRSEFKVFGEKQDTMAEKLDATYAQVVKNTEDIALLQVAVRELAHNLKSLTERVDKITERIDKLSERMNKIADKLDKNTDAIAALAKSIDNLAKTKSDHEDFLTLEKRVNTLEAKVASLA